MPSNANENVHRNVSEPGIGHVILKDVLAIAIAAIAILSFYFFVKAFSILAKIPP